MAFRILRTYGIANSLGVATSHWANFSHFCLTFGGMEIFLSLGTEKCNFVGLAGYTTVSAA